MAHHTRSTVTCIVRVARLPTPFTSDALIRALGILAPKLCVSRGGPVTDETYLVNGGCGYLRCKRDYFETRDRITVKERTCK